MNTWTKVIQNKMLNITESKIYANWQLKEADRGQTCDTCFGT